eukprot:458194-Lingulodinium_polyedra.AAC.1
MSSLAACSQRAPSASAARATQTNQAPRYLPATTTPVGPNGLWTMASLQSSRCCWGMTCVLMGQ